MKTYDHYTIYKTTNLINGKFYIGQHETNNINDNYIGSGHVFSHAVKKYGRKNFKKEILFDFDNWEDMNNKEIEIVDEDFVKRPDTYNVKLGGEYKCLNDGNGKYGYKRRCYASLKFIHSMSVKEYQKYKKKMSDIHKEIWNDKGEEFQKMLNERHAEYVKNNPDKIATFKNRKHTNSTIKKLKNAHSKINHFGKNNPTFGKIFIKNVNTGVTLLIDKNSKIPDGFVKGRILHWTKEGLMKCSQSAKNKMCITNSLKQNKMIVKNEEIPDGWFRGMNGNHYKNWSNKNKIPQ